MPYRDPANWYKYRPWQRHSIVLAVAGFVYILLGIVYLTQDPTPARKLALSVILRWAPFSFWGSLFIFTGCLALLSARWPVWSLTWGYSVLSALSAGWGSAYLLSIIFDNAPTINFTGTLTWGLVAFMWWGVSGLVNPEHLAKVAETVAVINDGPSSPS